jgi:hypothetical protein
METSSTKTNSKINVENIIYVFRDIDIDAFSSYLEYTWKVINLLHYNYIKHLINIGFEGNIYK